MGSMAFWYEKNSNTAGAQLDAVMNFNLWTQCDTSSASFLDIGFKISGISAARKLYYYIPFAGISVDDLSLKINKSKAIGAIFNEKYSVIDISDSNHFWPIRDDVNNSIAFVIYSWNNDSGDSAVQVIQKGYRDGVCLEIDVDKLRRQVVSIPNAQFTENDVFYFRFRIQIPGPKQSNTIVRKYTPPNSFLQSTLATTYIVDFRFDDLRSLPEAISSKIVTPNTDFVPVSKLHFLMMTKAHVDVETGARDISLRELEDETWDDYIDNKFDTKDVVAYHCAEKAKKEHPPIKQWEFFAKVKVNNSTWQVVIVYLLVLAVITIIFNLVSSFLWEWICSFFPGGLFVPKPGA